MLLLDSISSWLKFKLILYHQASDWPELCRTGKRQSPIAMCREKSKSASIPPLEFYNYNDRYNANVENNGHSVTIRLADDDECECDDSKVPTIKGGNLGGEFLLDNIHFHWEAEHTINGKRYPLEAHLVHFNKKCGSMKSALKHPDGLVILAVMFKTVNCVNRNLDNLIIASEKISCEVHNPTQIEQGIIVNHFLPKNKRKFYMYEGSLTTPNCNETVRWIVFEDPLVIGQEQIDKLTDMTTEEGEPLKENARGLQEQNNRQVLYATDTCSSVKNYIKQKLGLIP